MRIKGGDLHARQQTVAMFDTEMSIVKTYSFAAFPVASCTNKPRRSDL
jgi:hypothetical protein